MARKLKSLHQTGDLKISFVPGWWLRNLLDPAFKFEILLLGIPGRIRISPRWEVRQPPQKEHLFYFVAEGGFRAEIEGKAFDFKEGDFIWIPTGTEFHFWLPPDQALVIHRFRMRIAPGPGGKANFLSPRVLPKAWPCLTWMEQIIAETNLPVLEKPSPGRPAPRSGSGDRDSVRARGLLLCLFTELQRVEKAEWEPVRGLDLGQKQELMLFTARNAAKWPRPADLAAHLHLSHDYFSRLFAKSFGKSPRRWLVERRIHQAGLRLAESTLNVSQVADEFGYQDVFLFSRQFKNITGFSPRQFRRRSSAAV